MVELAASLRPPQPPEFGVDPPGKVRVAIRQDSHGADDSQPIPRGGIGGRVISDMKEDGGEHRGTAAMRRPGEDGGAHPKAPPTGARPRE